MPHYSKNKFEPGGLKAAPVSAARLAAEAAFSAPRAGALPGGQAQITVRRTRTLQQAPRPAALAQPRPQLHVQEQTQSQLQMQMQMQSQVHAHARAPLQRQLHVQERPLQNEFMHLRPVQKSPRVFRVEPASSDAAAPAVATPWAKQGPLEQRPSSVANAKDRRLFADKRPGPVVLLVGSSPKPTVLDTQAGRPRAGMLAAALARVGPALAAIESAQALQIVDARFEAQWQQLSKRTEDLIEQIRAGFKAG